MDLKYWNNYYQQHGKDKGISKHSSINNLPCIYEN
jgi:hypothetical protein